MRISEVVGIIRKENPLLYRTGLLSFILFGICLLLFFFDSRLVMGINPWIKPMKFGLSIGIYLWTFGWLLRHLTSKGNATLISWGIAICMIVENSIIALQAARGLPSHYNIATALDGVLFGVMGVFIGINAILIFYALILFLFTETNLDKNMLTAWQAGLFLFLIGGAAGGMMIGNLSHTIGATDGGAGIPFLNWSTVAGDLRSAHFITLHGLQAIPLFAYFISLKTKRPVLLTATFFVFYLLVCLRLHFVALQGKPFFDFL